MPTVFYCLRVKCFVIAIDKPTKKCYYRKTKIRGERGMNYCYEKVKKNITFYRILWCVLTVVFVALTVLGLQKVINSNSILWEAVYVFCPVMAAFSLAVAIKSFTIKYKEFTVNGNEVFVYAGLLRHYLFIGETIADKYDSFVSINDKLLIATVEEKEITVKISPFNAVNVTVSDKIKKEDLFSE